MLTKLLQLYKFIVQGMVKNLSLSLQKLLTFALQMQIETELETTQHDAISSAIKTIVDHHFNKGITAHEAVIHLMECTTMLPGVFCVQMLHFRQKLQDMIHNPTSFSGLYSLQYPLPVHECTVQGLPLTVDCVTQTDLVNPNGSNILEFNQREFCLQWTLP